MMRTFWEDLLGHFLCIFGRSIHRFFHRWDIGIDQRTMTSRVRSGEKADLVVNRAPKCCARSGATEFGASLRLGRGATSGRWKLRRCDRWAKVTVAVWQGASKSSDGRKQLGACRCLSVCQAAQFISIMCRKTHGPLRSCSAGSDQGVTCSDNC